LRRADSKSKKSDGGESSASPAGQGGITFKNYPIAALAGLLSNLPGIGRPVLDRTGLDGKYTFSANLTDTAPGASIGDIKRSLGEDADPVSSPVISNLQQQLGLKLEAVKASVEMIVIDQVTKTPTED
jgi:uncharacterized protein (TIGR03435 family)